MFNKLLNSKILLILVVGLFISEFTGLGLFPMKLVTPRTITVSAVAKLEEINQKASFNANLSATGSSKEEVNGAMQQNVDALVQSAKNFGVSDSNIKTQYFNIYQEEYTDYESRIPEVRKGPWRGNTTVNFKDIDASVANEFSDLLVSSGATSIDGPNFTTEDPERLDIQLSISALENAESKARQIAESNGNRLGRLINYSDAQTSNNFGNFASESLRLGGGGGGGFNPGSDEIVKSITATYEIY